MTPNEQPNGAPATPAVVEAPPKVSYEDYKKLRSAPPAENVETPAPGEQEHTGQPPVNGTAPDAQTGTHQERKPKQTASERFAELTAARKKVEEERDLSKAEVAKLQARIAELEKRPAEQAKPAEPKAPEPKPAETDPEPDLQKMLADAKDGESFVQVNAKFVKEWRAWEKRQDAKATEEAKRKDQESAAKQTHAEKMAKANAKFPGLQAKIDGAAAAMPDVKNEGLGAGLQSIDDGEVLGAVLDHFASDHAEYRRVCAMTPVQAYKEVLRLELKFSTPQSPEPGKPKSTPVSSAPAPAKGVEQAPAPSTPDPSKMSYEQYRDYRTKQQARG